MVAITSLKMVAYKKLLKEHFALFLLGYGILGEYVKKSFVTRNAKTIDWIRFLCKRRELLSMSGIEKGD